MSGSHFLDYHQLLDEQAAQIFAMTDVIAERVRKIGGTTLHSIARSVGCSASRATSVPDDDALTALTLGVGAMVFPHRVEDEEVATEAVDAPQQ
jgi:DNA-binding ferritin-like protein